jgi:hypothetical protein
MSGPSTQLPHDRILWILTEHGGVMERSRLRVAARMRNDRLNSILEDLARDGKINITACRYGVMIPLKKD